MPKRTHAGALTVLATTALALGVTLAVQAGATPQTRFLSAAELPPHRSSSWTAGRVTDGVPVELRLCLDETLPGYDSRYRAFHTELDTGARQLTIGVGSTAKASALATRLNKEIRSCATRIEQADPETQAAYRSYGKVPVEEGARVHGLHTTTSWGATDIHLLSVGRDGRTVTVVEWSQLGDFDDAPVPAFKETTATAVNKLH
ncbi:hypothetical protein [Streptomyces fulvoviolaceus]|uniref:hypothetical protein n=1 Tax=Streptomyces fulvoviolaceus TaxID=285535 RepID=UPI0004CA9288|nr:hypothetical protein [Streptomyces fulvoviolaceus]MCT9079564.1 hypothetical protein [Streptomyces fulvoviolaceus]